ncbi:MAG: RnfABCDGE type electron transport complex subunit B [Burkholderiales bacterium]|nr:RnfABCDGE type electron transport complex subunit B [Burkholderiales bacterium]
MTGAALAASLLDALPQTQCTRCGYPDCRGYAEAIAAGEAEVNRCPPGGAEGVARLASIAGRTALPLDPECGNEAPRAVAAIDESACIGCALCLKACPTDAILGSATRMHTVVASLCTGCELCLPVCPVDCIALVPASGERTGWDAWSPAEAEQARRRYELHRRRLGAPKLPAAVTALQGAASNRQEAIAAAIARARAARAGS